MFAEVISIGDELTSGQSLDTNAQWLSQKLAEAGIQVCYHTTVGDDMKALVAVFRTAIERVDLVIATGGLGPTADDLTREAISRTTGCRLVCDKTALDHIRSVFARRGRQMPEQNRVQALFPEGSRIVSNPDGTAPGIAMTILRQDSRPTHFYCLPGVPAEMRQMWTETVEKELARVSGPRRCIRSRRVRCFGAGESAVEAMLPDLIRRGRDPRVGITAGEATITLTVTAEGANEQECHAALDPTLATIRACLGHLVFGEDDDRLEDAVVRLLRTRQETIATIEWATQGLVIRSLDDAADGGREIRGGVVIAREQALAGLLGLPADVIPIDARNPAHQFRLVEAMARECRNRFASDYALAVGPPPEHGRAGDAIESLAVAVADSNGSRADRIPVASHPAIATVFRSKKALDFLRLDLLAR
ncbi:MAG: CinA family nicotinamide mononucleotide deamidase-related protein [Pirellulaceae bacterium]|nr:CinA family nicotinamide mononucleotide deamidase-related protein [Pirellulaceae bacterium]